MNERMYRRPEQIRVYAFQRLWVQKIFDVELVRTYDTHGRANWLLCDNVPMPDTWCSTSGELYTHLLSLSRRHRATLWKICSKCWKTRKMPCTHTLFEQFFLCFYYFIDTDLAPLNLLYVCATRDKHKCTPMVSERERAQQHRTNRNVHVWSVKH